MRPPADRVPLGHVPFDRRPLAPRPIGCGLFDLGSLAHAADAEAFARYPAYRQVLVWLDTFVTRPHLQLGRPGAVCPRLSPALRRNLVVLVTARAHTGTPDEAVRIGQALPELYRSLFPDPDDFRAGALLAVCPDLPADIAATFIDGGHARLRPAFVGQGLMLGEFHPASTVGSVHKPHLPVMRSPVPMFAVRALTRHDLLFLDRPDIPAGDRERYLRDYLHHVGPQLPDSERDEILARLSSTAGAR